MSHPGADEGLLVIEMSDSSLAYDRGRKLTLYAKFQVPEVWIVDISGAAIEVFREPKESRYLACSRQTCGSLAPALLPHAAIDITVLFA
jgi:Uma2 family endonuclease